MLLKSVDYIFRMSCEAAGSVCLFAEGGDCAVSAEICQVCIWMSTGFGNQLCFSHGHTQT